MTQKTNIHYPTVSIGMPVYNGEKYIREALDSLLAQSFTDFELVISDNSSTDATAEICGEYVKKDSRIRYIRQNSNIGALANFKFVLQEASGEFFMWAAFDDKWSTNWIAVLHEKLESSNLGAVFGLVVPVDLNLNPYAHIAVNQKFRYGCFRYFRRIKFFLDYEGRGKANLFYSLFKLSLIKQVNLYSNRYDYSIIYDSMSKFGYSSVENTFLYKRNDSHNEGNTYNFKRSLTIRVLDNIFPISLKLIIEYLALSNIFEKLCLSLLLPLKVLIAYYWLINSKLLKLK